jgi:hypothetical protein
MPSTPGAGLLAYRLGEGGAAVLLFRRTRLRHAAGAHDPLQIPTWELDPPTGPGAAPHVGLPFDSRPRVKQRVVAQRSLDQLLELARRDFALLTGLEPPGPFLPLGGAKMRLHRVVYVWACAVAEAPRPDTLVAGPGRWPAAGTTGDPEHGPGGLASVLSVRRPYIGAEFLLLAEARALIEPQQRRFLDQLEGLLARPAS